MVPFEFHLQNVLENKIKYTNHDRGSTGETTAYLPKSCILTWARKFPILMSHLKHLLLSWINQAKVGSKHESTISCRFGFSSAAATRSLSFNCLFTGIICNEIELEWSTEKQKQKKGKKRDANSKNSKVLYPRLLLHAFQEPPGCPPTNRFSPICGRINEHSKNNSMIGRKLQPNVVKGYGEGTSIVLLDQSYKNPTKHNSVELRLNCLFVGVVIGWS